MLELVRISLLILTLIIASYTDLKQRKIYNWLTFPVIGLGIGFAGGEVVLNNTWNPFFPIILGTLISLFIFTIPFFLGWFGGGDIKLLIAISCLQGAPFHINFIPHAIYNTTIVGAAMAILTLIWKGSILQGLKGSLNLMIHPLAHKDSNQKETIPYGLAISIGTLWTLFSSVPS